MNFFKFYFFFFISLACFSQELPPINNFTPLTYNGGNQNWSVSQSAQKNIYVGNNYGLLEFNGARWKTYSSPNGSYMRSVKVVNELVYTGCYMEFGFWKKDVYGDLKYQSLKPLLKTSMIEDEEFWNILQLDKWILFQSLHRIYIYNTEDKSFTIIDSESTRARIFKVKDAVYFQDVNKGLLKIENGKGILISDDSFLKTNIIIGFFELNTNTIVVTEKEGFFILKDGKLKKWDIPINERLKGVNIYSCQQLKDGSFVLGTISDGVFFVNSSGELIENISQKNGLYNNTIHSIFEDVEGNIWLALNNGISVINLNSPFKEYLDKIGKLGVVYAVSVFDDHLYLGTNQGLFYKSKDGSEDFKIIENTNGQVWFLKEIDNVLFCGHNDGTFIISKDKAENISNFPGTWDVKKIPGKENLLLQGNYQGLSVLQKENGKWVFRNKIDGFNISSRFFEFTKTNDVIINHEFKGIFRLTFDTDFKKADKVVESSVMGAGASLVIYEDTIVYMSNNGIFKFNEQSKKFEFDKEFTALFFDKEEEPIGILISDSDRLWSFSDKSIMLIEPNKFNGSKDVRKIAIPNSFRRSIGVLGFENIKPINTNNYLIGISNGYITVDLEKLKTNDYTISLNEVHNRHSDSILLEKVPLNKKINEFNYKRNNLYFKYSVPNFDKYTEVSYQYQLIGLNDLWSPWSDKLEVSFENLPYGEYVFNVRSRVGDKLSQNTASFSYEVLKPWYLTNLAYLIYFILFSLLAFLIHKLYRKHYFKQQQLALKENQKKLKRKKIKAEKKLIQIKNENLNQEINNKSRELAISTMSIIKKNEFLNTIKQQLQESKTPNQINAVIKTIDRNINNEDDWKFFEDAFNNADKEFLKNLRDTHPELTPNDLRLCAYLRLNLSSKEIAPLLNISVRSVEVKRYRLRKKMNLPHESSLTDYILKL